MKTADAVVVGSPIYIMQMTGPVKNLYDRFFPLTDDRMYRPRFGTKKMVTVYTQGMDDPPPVRVVLRVHGGHVPLVRLRTGGEHRLHRTPTTRRPPSTTPSSRSEPTRRARRWHWAESSAP